MVFEQLSEAGVDAIEVSGAWLQSHPKDEFYYKDSATQAAEGALARGKAKIILTGGNRDFDAMTQVLNETPIEYFALSRPLIAEPDLANRWESGDTFRSKCISCNGCIRQKQELMCTVNN